MAYNDGPTLTQHLLMLLVARVNVDPALLGLGLGVGFGVGFGEAVNREGRIDS